MADAAYHTHAREPIEGQGIKPRIMRRPSRHHRAAAAAGALQPADIAAPGGRRDDLRHAQASHGADLIRYVGLAKAQPRC